MNRPVIKSYAEKMADIVRESIERDLPKDGELTYPETLALNDLLNFVRAACGAEVRWVDKLQNDAKNGGKLSKFKQK